MYRVRNTTTVAEVKLTINYCVMNPGTWGALWTLNHHVVQFREERERKDTAQKDRGSHTRTFILQRPLTNRLPSSPFDRLEWLPCHSSVTNLQGALFRDYVLVSTSPDHMYNSLWTHFWLLVVHSSLRDSLVVRVVPKASKIQYSSLVLQF